MATDLVAYAIYQDRVSFEAALDALRAAGFRNSDVSAILPERDRTTKDLAHEINTKAPEGAATGAGTGAAVGGVLGWLVGIGALAIPGIGPLVAAGPVVAALARRRGRGRNRWPRRRSDWRRYPGGRGEAIRRTHPRGWVPDFRPLRRPRVGPAREGDPRSHKRPRRRQHLRIGAGLSPVSRVGRHRPPCVRAQPNGNRTGEFPFARPRALEMRSKVPSFGH